MIFNINSIDDQQNRIQLDYQSKDVGDNGYFSYRNEQELLVGSSRINIEITIDSSNKKGNLVIKCNGLVKLNCLMSIEDSFLLMTKVDGNGWLELIISEY